MYGQYYCLLIFWERWQWSSRNHSCLWSMTTKKIVWRSSLPQIDDDNDGDLEFISMCHGPWHEGWSVERICLWSMVSQRRVWRSSLALIDDGEDVDFMMASQLIGVVIMMWPSSQMTPPGLYRQSYEGRREMILTPRCNRWKMCPRFEVLAR